jgi:hypothetical protein
VLVVVEVVVALVDPAVEAVAAAVPCSPNRPFQGSMTNFPVSGVKRN